MKWTLYIYVSASSKQCQIFSPKETRGAIYILVAWSSGPARKQFSVFVIYINIARRVSQLLFCFDHNNLFYTCFAYNIRLHRTEEFSSHLYEAHKSLINSIHTLTLPPKEAVNKHVGPTITSKRELSLSHLAMHLALIF